MILDQINKRWLSWLNANLRRQIEDANKKYEEAARKSEADEREKAELRRRIAELEQQRNGNGAK